MTSMVNGETPVKAVRQLTEDDVFEVTPRRGSRSDKELKASDGAMSKC